MPISEVNYVRGPKPIHEHHMQKGNLLTESEHGTYEVKDRPSSGPGGLFPAIRAQRGPIPPLDPLDDLSVSAGGSSVMLQPAIVQGQNSRKSIDSH